MVYTVVYQCVGVFTNKHVYEHTNRHHYLRGPLSIGEVVIYAERTTEGRSANDEFSMVEYNNARKIDGMLINDVENTDHTIARAFRNTPHVIRKIISR